MLLKSRIERLKKLGLAAFLICGCLQSAVSAEGVSIYQKLGEYEKVLFGQQESSLTIEKRLQRIEKQLFGKASKEENTGKRIAEIDKAMGGKNSAYYPPIAPELDRSEFAPEPKAAPENPHLADTEISNPEAAPAPAESADRIKGMLREAMQAYSSGKSAEAERIFQKVLSADFRNTDANYNMGAIAESKGDLKKARNYYATALKGSPDDLELKDALNSVEQKLRKQSSAQSGSQEDIRARKAPVSEADKAIAEDAAADYRKGNFDEAIKKLGYLALKDPYDANIQFALGQAYRGRGDHKEAIRHLSSAAALDKNNELYAKALREEESAVNGGRTSSDGSSGTSDVTPFVGLPTDDSSQPADGGGSELAAVQNYLRRNGGNVMMGSVYGYGSPMSGLGSGIPLTGLGMGLSGMSYGGNSPGGMRLRRVMSSSLTGAAIGALSNRSYAGGMSRGAMRGALYGGLFGLMMNGF